MQDRFSLEDACAEERISLSSVNVSEDSEREGSYVKWRKVLDSRQDMST